MSDTHFASDRQSTQFPTSDIANHVALEDWTPDLHLAAQQIGYVISGIGNVN